MSNAIATLPATLSIPVHEIDGEPRILDTDLAKALETVRPETIRETVKAHRAALEELGVYRPRRLNPLTTWGGGAPVRPSTSTRSRPPT